MTAEEMIMKNVAFVKSEIARAAEEAGRDPAEVRLVAATKMNDVERIRAAIRGGVDICGENRVQEMLEKNAQGAYESVPLHFIGHLQRNKVRQVVGLCALIHSVDSLGLLQEIARTAKRRDQIQDILLEVNIGGEASKSGFTPEEMEEILSEAAKLDAVRVRGLMAIPVPAGEHNIEFTYFPAGLKVCSIISMLTAAVIIVGVIWKNVRSGKTNVLAIKNKA